MWIREIRKYREGSAINLKSGLWTSTEEEKIDEIYRVPQRRDNRTLKNSGSRGKVTGSEE